MLIYHDNFIRNQTDLSQHRDFIISEIKLTRSNLILIRIRPIKLSSLDQASIRKFDKIYIKRLVFLIFFLKKFKQIGLNQVIQIVANIDKLYKGLGTSVVEITKSSGRK